MKNIINVLERHFILPVVFAVLLATKDLFCALLSLAVQILIDLMKRLGGMLFVLVMKLLVVLSGFLMMSFMLMMLDGD